MSRFRGCLTNALLILFGIFFALFMLEIGARQFYKIEGQIYTYDPTTGYTHLPNSSFRVVAPDFTVTYATNNQGLRGPDIDLDQLSDCVILGLGDSFTFGIGVEYDETYLEVMRQTLSTSPQADIQLINSGHGGWGTAQQLAYLEAHVEQFNPDLIVLGIFLNDVKDNLSPLLYTIDDNGELISLGPVSKSSTDEARETVSRILLYGWLSENSALMATIRMFAQNIVTSNDPNSQANAQIDISDPKQRQELLDLERLLLRRIQEVSNEHEAPVIYLFIPNKDIKVDDDVRDMCESDMMCLDVKNELFSEHSPDELYYSHDGHWTALAHDIAGRTIAEYIVENELLDCANQ